jgi:hypothetical protein
MNHRHDTTDAGPASFLFCLILFIILAATAILVAI